MPPVSSMSWTIGFEASVIFVNEGWASAAGANRTRRTRALMAQERDGARARVIRRGDGPSAPCDERAAQRDECPAATLRAARAGCHPLRHAFAPAHHVARRLRVRRGGAL